MSNKRQLKIQPLYKKNQFSKTVKPKLTLSGDWLQKAGFNIGESVNIEIQKNKLIIKI